MKSKSGKTKSIRAGDNSISLDEIMEFYKKYELPMNGNPKLEKAPSAFDEIPLRYSYRTEDADLKRSSYRSC